MDMKNMTTTETNDAPDHFADSDFQDQHNNGGSGSRRKLLPFSLKIKKFKNKYFQRSIYSILFIITFLVIALVNFVGIELFFKIIQKYFSNPVEDGINFEIRPRNMNQKIIEINNKNWENLSNDIKNYLKLKSPESCESNDEFYCLLTNETKGKLCSEGLAFGMKSGSPCVLIDLKPMSKWFNHNMTEENQRINLKCEGEKSVDQELIGPIEYYPRNGVPLKYFSKSTRSSPFIFVHFQRPALGVIFFVECQLFSASEKEMKILDKSLKFEMTVDL